MRIFRVLPVFPGVFPFKATKITSEIQISVIGLATSTSGRPGTFADALGHAIITTNAHTTSEPSAIDPNLLVDKKDGIWLLTFGSFYGGIYQLELDPVTGDKKPGARIIGPIAKRPDSGEDALEAPSLFQKGARK